MRGGARLPLSAGQKRLWLERLVDPSRAIGDLTLTFDAGPGADARALDEAVRRVVGRHDALRAHLDDHEPAQTLGECRARWTIDASGVMTMIVPRETCDDASLAVLRAELSEVWGPASAGPAPAEAGAYTGPRTYAEAIAAEQRAAEGDVWAPRLPPPTVLPPDSHGGDGLSVRRFDTPRDTAALLAAFAVLVQRYSGEDDIVIGIPARFGDAVGCFTNLLPLRIGDASRESVRAGMDEVQRHAAIPFDRLLDAVRPPRAPGRHPLFEIVFSVSDQEPTAPARFDVELTVTPTGACLVYRPERYSGAWAEALLENYERLLGQDDDARAADPAMPPQALAADLVAVHAPGEAMDVLAKRGVAIWIDPAWPEARQRMARETVPASVPGVASLVAGGDGLPRVELFAAQHLDLLLHWEREHLSLDAGDRVAVLGEELLPAQLAALAAGAALSSVLDAETTILHITPAAARAHIARLLAPLPLPRLRWTLFSGEPLTDGLVERWRRGFPNPGRILNLYAASCAYEVADPPLPGVQPIGFPLPGVDVRVVAANGRVCGVSEIGEIAVRGRRTGDVGRRRADGALEIRGRVDRQVTIAGARVQPAEVERALLALPFVSAATVTAPAGVDGERRLVAHVMSTEGVAIIAAALAEQLPPAMIPASIVLADDTPAEEPIDAVAPRDPVELQLARLWEELLEVPSVGVRDDFFALGGDSLVAVRMLARVRDEFGHSLDPSVLLPDATIEHLARLLRQHPAASTPLVTIQRGAREPALFCVHPSGGSVLCYVDLARSMGAGRPVYGLKGPDPRRDTPPPSEASAMAAEYVAALRASQPRGPYALAGYSFGGLIAFEMGQQFRRAGEEVALVALLDTRFPREYGPGDRNPVVDLGEALERHDLDRDEADDHELWRELMEVASRYIPPRRGRGFAAVQEFCRLYRLIPAGDELGYQDLRRFLRNLRANFRTMRGYSPAPAGGRVVLFAADRTLAGEESDHLRNAALWRGVAPRLEVRTFRANHFNLLAPPAVDAVAAGLAALMAVIG
jgi:thioesterase domain-containing protein/non-ribosomal peptide synthetase component F